MDGTEPRFADALSTSADSSIAVAEVAALATERLKATPDLAVVFVSHHHESAFATLAAGIQAKTKARFLIGCTGESIVAGGKEVENGPALSLWLAALPGVAIEPIRLSFEQTSEGGSFIGWPDSLADEWPKDSALVILADPYTFAADELAARINEDHPGVPLVGGMASGGHGPGTTRLFQDGDEIEAGAIGVFLHGNLHVRTVVSQGCRPIGQRYIITKAHRNIVQELGGKPSLTQLQEAFSQLPPEDQERVQNGLHLGRVLNEYQETFGPGDFLIRNVIGADPERGVIAVGDYVRAGQTVQFHVRDARTADEELRTLLAAAREAGAKPKGGLLFTCNGRGTRLFPQPNHDAAAVQELLGPVPLAGFFAQGELGPVSGKNFLHGFTASAIFFE